MSTQRRETVVNPKNKGSAQLSHHSRSVFLKGHLLRAYGEEEVREPVYEDDEDDESYPLVGWWRSWVEAGVVEGEFLKGDGLR